MFVVTVDTFVSDMKNQIPNATAAEPIAVRTVGIENIVLTNLVAVVNMLEPASTPAASSAY